MMPLAVATAAAVEVTLLVAATAVWWCGRPGSPWPLAPTRSNRVFH